MFAIHEMEDCCANKRRVGYILVPENYTFLARVLFRGYIRREYTCVEGRNLEEKGISREFVLTKLGGEVESVRERFGHLAALFFSSIDFYLYFIFIIGMICIIPLFTSTIRVHIF